MSQATLTAHGRRPWSRALALLSGFTCAWADLDGFHLGAVPAEPPLTTHLWAWQDRRLLRLRVDGPECVIGQLDLGPSPSSQDGQAVEVIERHSRTWPLGEGRVGAADQWRNLSTTLFEVVGLMPLTFARLDGAQP